MVTSPEYRAPDGPRWVPGATLSDAQVDGRGAKWLVLKIKDGGRVIVWATATGAYRQATTAVVPTHPDYPSDATVLAWQRAQRRALRA